MSTDTFPGRPSAWWGKVPVTMAILCADGQSITRIDPAGGEGSGAGEREITHPEFLVLTRRALLRTLTRRTL